MSLTVTQRPYQTINSEVSKWNAVGNPILYKFQRKDQLFDQVQDDGSGNAELVIFTVDVTANYTVGDSVYVSFNSDSAATGIYSITAKAFTAGQTLLTIDLLFSVLFGSDTGFINNLITRTSYKIEIGVYDSLSAMLSDSPFSYSPNTDGAVTADISAILRSNLSPDNTFDLSASTEVYDETNFKEFFIKYREVWSSSAESETSDTANRFFVLLGANQIPSLYGGNLYEHLILSDMKIFDVTIATGAVLTGNGTPIDVSDTPAAGSIIVPIMWLVFLDYNSVAYATNTTFRFEINGVAVSGTNTTILPGVADRYTTILPIAYDTTTDLRANPIKFEVQTGNPTAGNSPIRVVSIYTIQSLS